LYYSQIAVSGSVNDTQIGAMTVNVRANNGPITRIDVTGAHNWATSRDAPILLNEGNNTISVQAIDLDGNASGWVSTTCSYTRTSPLYIAPSSGSGTTSLSGSSFQLTGSIITIKATPGPGYLFDHWEGTSGIPALGAAPTPLTDAQSKQATLKFAMQPFASVRAVFSPNPFGGITGNYSGTLTPGDQPALGGVFTLTLTPSGSFSGKLTSQGVSYPIKGQFDATGQFTGTFGTAKNPITLWLTIDLQGGKQIAGTALIGPDSASASLSGDLGVWSSSHPIPSGAGSYTFLIPAPAPGDATTPQGNGFGTATITPGGVAKFSGVLGDGCKFTASCSLSKDLAFNFSTPMYNKLGILFGVGFVFPSPGSSDFSGYMTWYKPPIKGTSYPDGFYLMPALVGSVFKSSIPIDFSGGTAYVSYATSGTDATVINSKLALANAGVNTYKAVPLPNAAPSPEKLNLIVQPTTGYFTGSYSNGSTNIALKGVLFQDQFLGAGLAPNKPQNASVLIQTKDYNTGYISIF
jgi:hypothetical protein